MSALGGDLIVHPKPERPGSWAYRLLDGGRLLETELTSKARRQLDDQAAAKRRARIAVRNQHRRNQAAKRRLEQEGSRPVGNVMYLLELGITADPEEGKGDAGLLLDKWRLTVARQQMALGPVEGGASPDEVKDAPWDRVLEYLLRDLQTLESSPVTSTTITKRQ